MFSILVVATGIAKSEAKDTHSKATNKNPVNQSGVCFVRPLYGLPNKIFGQESVATA